MENPLVELTEIHRVAEGNPIIQLSKNIRESGDFKRYMFSDQENISFMNRADLKVSTIRNLNPDIILCAYKKTRDTMNALVRTARGHYEYTPDIGELVICDKNGFSTEDITIYNGERFKIVDKDPSATKDFWYRKVDEQNRTVTDKEVGIKYTLETIDRSEPFIITSFIPDKCWDGITPSYYGRDMGQFNFAYAITVHRSQGSEYQNVLVLDEKLPTSWDKKAFRYTAVTRASERITIAQ